MIFYFLKFYFIFISVNERGLLTPGFNVDIYIVIILNDEKVSIVANYLLKNLLNKTQI